MKYIVANFPKILNKAKKEWPKKFDFRSGQNLNSNEKLSDVFQRVGMIDEIIDEKWISHPFEAIFRNLHHAIQIQITKAARVMSVVRLSELRNDLIQEEFERILRKQLEDRYHLSPEKYKEVIRNYFQNDLQGKGY